MKIEFVKLLLQSCRQDDGVPDKTMKECAKCRRCYDDSHVVCPIDDKPLIVSITCNVLISGRYLLEERLGKGGMGIVFKAKHKFLKSSHAIKLILPSLVEDDDALLVRFKQEAILAASIDHPNVIRVTDFGVEDETMPYLVMEYVDGSPLSSYLVKDERLTPERAFELFQPIALGVAEAHSQRNYSPRLEAAKYNGSQRSSAKKSHQSSGFRFSENQINGIFRFDDSSRNDEQCDRFAAVYVAGTMGK